MDYEALGRHTEAVDGYEKARSDRDKKACEINRLLRPVCESLNQNPSRIDAAKLKTLFGELLTLNDVMMMWMDKANVEAERAGKYRLEFGLI